MKFCGISGVASKLMESYLRSGYQRVVINAHNNTNVYFYKWKKKVKHCVPHGSVLGPVLYLIYINDLSKHVSDKSSPVLFADDTSFITANHDETRFIFKINDTLTEINKWFRSNLLMLNMIKHNFCSL
jgi:hypothetical protein